MDYGMFFVHPMYSGVKSDVDCVHSTYNRNFNFSFIDNILLSMTSIYLFRTWRQRHVYRFKVQHDNIIIVISIMMHTMQLHPSNRYWNNSILHINYSDCSDSNDLYVAPPHYKVLNIGNIFWFEETWYYGNYLLYNDSLYSEIYILEYVAHQWFIDSLYIN